MVWEKTTDVAAVAAVASPLWMQLFESVSSVAALILPILGVLWMLIQIYYKVFKGDKSRDREAIRDPELPNKGDYSNYSHPTGAQ